MRSVVHTLLLLFILTPTFLFAQEKTPILFLGSLVTPHGYTEGYLLREYIRSDDFAEETNGLTDPEKLDLIYDEAYSLCRGDFTAAVLASAVSTLEHRNIEVKLLFGASVTFPLTFESEEKFVQRVERLPTHIISDRTEDKDKMQHFFLSAYLKRTLQMNSLVRLLGSLVEIGEEAFIVGGMSDERDIEANEDGIRFAVGDTHSPLTKPSEYLGAKSK